MNYIWTPTIDDIIEAIELAKKNGKKEGESYEEEFLEVMNKNNKKSIGATELTREEFITEQCSHGKAILSMEVDNTGKQTNKIYKEKKNV